MKQKNKGKMLHEGGEDLPDARLVGGRVVDEPEGWPCGVGVQGARAWVVGHHSDDYANLGVML